MANIVTPVETLEADVARTRAMLRRFTGLPVGSGLRLLIVTAIRRIVVSQEAQVEAETAAQKQYNEPEVS